MIHEEILDRPLTKDELLDQWIESIGANGVWNEPTKGEK